MSFSFITALRSFHHHKKITTKLYADITYIPLFFVDCSNRNHQNYVVVSRKSKHKNQEISRNFAKFVKRSLQLLEVWQFRSFQI